MWCPRRESNSHTLRRRILNPLRLPFRHSGNAGRVYRPAMRSSMHSRRQGLGTEKVSQSAMLPDSSPVANQRIRCSEVPWVKDSGIG